ncbi:NAD(P)/FAD-dependent oxidoreductase [Methylobacterium sp. BTF04]|uniref:NAD(P)/FAD-dependent oxidoreductase n=1 Tax=Methylobacterium sp. BTF04 TaxID=2708300 RepID=UPI0013D2FB4E|nr:NAD(P)/FAD-dependent oxidoreductase [Methylobacterium sp. BTF04]NEU14526.1 NAD(P)/FAD-dependent oxidoreductase [Methylobacterium sp. BTF04]
MTPVLDCLVIGGGPAGLTAAIYLGRFRRSVLSVDKGWSRAKWITLSHNLPGFPEGISGPDLLARMREQARRYGATLEHGTVEGLRRDADGLFLAKVGETEVAARTVLLAAGVVENNPPLPHVAEAVKSGLIRTCPICDGYEAIGKSIAVLGNGEHAAAEALFIRTFSEQVTLLMPASGDGGLSSATRAALLAADIATLPVVVGSVALDTSGVIAVGVADGITHRFDRVYSAFGIVPQSMLAVAAGAQVDATTRLFVDGHQETSIRGLFAAGDLVRGLNQIAVADGEAAIAATAIHNRLDRVLAHSTEPLSAAVPAQVPGVPRVKTLGVTPLGPFDRIEPDAATVIGT